ncbi:hypothetical protein JWH04_01870, partial [Xanthomonas melonis]|nr:hypothetical protein [Xanthomonas melonis]
MPGLYLLQRLADVLGAGDRCNALHAIDSTLQMRNRTIGAELAARAALQLHRAIAHESLRLARALSRQL